MSKSSSSYDLAVVGAGVIGLAIGWEMARRGASVLVLERDRVAQGTSRVAAGMLAPTSEARAGEPAVLELGLRAAAEYPGWLAELQDATGREVHRVANGTLLAARDHDEAEALARDIELRETLGVAVRRLLPSQARELEPALAPGLRLAAEALGDHALDPRELCAGLAQAFERSGGELLEHAPVRAVLVDDDHVGGVQLQAGEVISARNVVIAAGAWAAQIELPESAQIPLRPVKGQILRCHDPAGPGLLGRVLRYGSGYIVPRGDGRYVIGATMEERGFDASVTAGGAHELLRDACELVPGIDEWILDELSAGLRPATPDNAPAIGPGSLDGLLWATGHHRHGVLLAPVTARLIAESLQGEPVPCELRPERFAALSA